MNHNKRRTFPLKLIQISFIKGCSKLQQAVWRFCSKEPQMALSNKISLLILSQAIKYLINAREKLRKQVIKNMIQKWSKNAQLMSISNLNKINILKNRINRIDSYKRFILSKAMKNWKIKKEKIVKNLLKGMAIIKLYESFSKKKCKFSFRSRINNIMIAKNSRKPTRGFLNLYEKSKNSMKRRALKYWRSRVQDINNQNKKRQLVLKKIVKSLIGKNNAAKKNALYKWRYSTLEIRNENNIFMLRRGLLTISLYSKWHKIKLLNALSITSNEWRSEKGSNYYKEKIFQTKPHLFRHNINMKGKKVTNNLPEKYNFKLRGVKFKRYHKKKAIKYK